MTKAALKNFRSVLEAREADLVRILSKREAAAIERVADMMDQITQAQDRELSLGTLTRESRFLAETRAARQRIEDGSFGVCIDCDEDINPKRLAAVPWAPRCIQCQERAEREEGDTGGSELEEVAA